MAYRNVLMEDQRLVILKGLDEMNGEANESILQTIMETYGHRIGRDAVRTRIAWLNEQALISVRDVSGCMVATLNQRGLDVAQGRVTVPGVKRPSPRG